MSHTRFEQTRIQQLTSLYSPEAPPRLPLDFGDYLSLLWRLDYAADHAAKTRYYRRCSDALGQALKLPTPLLRLVETAKPKHIYKELPNMPYRQPAHLIDAHDRKASIAQLVQLRDETLRIGTTQENWGGSFPGSGIQDEELRERVFAVLFTALQGQFSNFGRILLVIDIVLSDLLVGLNTQQEITLNDLVDDFGYPNPQDHAVRRDFLRSPDERV